MMTLKKLVPRVLTKQNSEIVEVAYNPTKIIESIVKETDLDEKNAMKVTIEVTKILISANIDAVTAPMIRETACTCMLRLGFLKARYQYTRIGMPMFDFKDMLVNYENKLEKEEMSLKDLLLDVFLKIKFEYDEVKKIINKNDIGVELLVSGYTKKVE